MVLTPEEIRGAIEDVVASIVQSVIRCLSATARTGAGLRAGMYLVRWWRAPRAWPMDRTQTECRCTCRRCCLAEAVVLGAGHCIEHYDALKSMFMGARK
ncbi:MAG: hypothetical protein R2715_06060 [Ilumatobacteraceae bacterium]